MSARVSREIDGPTCDDINRPVPDVLPSRRVDDLRLIISDGQAQDRLDLWLPSKLPIESLRSPVQQGPHFDIRVAWNVATRLLTPVRLPEEIML